MWYLKNWTLKFAVSLLAFTLITPFLLSLVPSVTPNGGLLAGATSTGSTAVTANVANVIVTATPDYRPANDDEDWQKPSPVSVPVHVTCLAALLFVFWAWWFSIYGWRRPIVVGEVTSRIRSAGFPPSSYQSTILLQEQMA